MRTSWHKKLGFCPKLCLLFCLLCLALGACTQSTEKLEKQEDYVLGLGYLQERNFSEAQMYFERYLRLNVDGKYRWQAWQNLLDIALNYRNEKAAALNYLNVMLLEYETDPARRSGIKKQLADLANELRQYNRAVATWESILLDNNLPAIEQSRIYRQLSKAYLRRMEFTQATAMLNNCVNLDIIDSLKAECLYELAETQTITADLGAATESLRKLLAMSGAESSTKVLGTFLLADVLEQLGQKQEAIALFESLLGLYPNERVIAMRIDYIKNKKLPVR